MTAPIFENVFNTGGGNLHFVFHVSGYPWAVSNSQEVIDLLDHASYISQRRYIFGTANDSTDYFADYTEGLTKIFPNLLIPGKQTWTVDEGKGALTGGDWDVEIIDTDLGHDWSYGNVNFRGLDGVHRVAQPFNDKNVGWGYLTDTFKIGATTLSVSEQNGSVLWNSIDGESSFPYCLIWIGQECLAASAAGAKSNSEFTITVPDAGGTRGLFRSREQNHWIEDFVGTNPIVSDTPFSIIDKPCWLWGVLLSEDNSSILGNPVLLRSGKVSPRIQTSKGKTKINVLSPLKQLDQTMPLPKFRGKMHHYIFARVTNTTNTIAQVKYHQQCPHLVIKEFSSASDDDGTDRLIWLCASGSTVTFEHAGQMWNTLLNELDLCTAGSGSQISGGQTLSYAYYMKDAMLYQAQKSGGSAVTKLSLLSGPLAWIFGLGQVDEDKAFDAYNKVGGLSPWYEYAHDVMSYSSSETNRKQYWEGYHWQRVYKDGDTTQRTTVVPGISSKRVDFIAKYYYGFLWSMTDLGYNSYPSYLDEPLFAFTLPTGKIFLDPEISKSAFAASDIINLGCPSEFSTYEGFGGRYAQFVVSSTATSGSYDYIVPVGSELTAVPGFMGPFKYGSGITYMPVSEEIRLKGEKENENASKYASESILEEPTTDPWYMSSPASGTCANVAGIFRGLLGESGSGIAAISDVYQLTNIVGFTDTGDFNSMIDWDDLNEKAKKLHEDQYYRISMGTEINLYKLLCQELLFHGLAPTLEWDKTNYQYMIRFRPLGQINRSLAAYNGREITESIIEEGSKVTETHNDTWLFNKISTQFNHDGQKFLTNINVEYSSGNAANRESARSLDIKSIISRVDNIEEMNRAQLEGIYNHFGNMVKLLATPNPVHDIGLTMAGSIKIAVGREALITNPAAHKPYTHELGLSDDIALVTRLAIDYRKGKCNVTYRLHNDYAYGWAPAARVAATSSSKAGGDTVTATTTANYFTPSGSRVDSSYFDCLSYNSSTGEYTAKGCGCGNYAVIAFERYNDDPDMLYFDVTAVNTSTYVLTLVDQDSGGGYPNYTAWDTTKEYIIIFSTYDNCESCQQKYVFFADDNNYLGAGDDIGMRWG